MKIVPAQELMKIAFVYACFLPLKLRTLQDLQKNNATTDAMYWIIHIVSFLDAVRYYYMRGSSLFVPANRASSKASRVERATARVPRIFRNFVLCFYV